MPYANLGSGKPANEDMSSEGGQGTKATIQEEPLRGYWSKPFMMNTSSLNQYSAIYLVLMNLLRLFWTMI